MADNTDLLNQIRSIVQDEIKPIKDTQQTHGEKLNKLGEVVGKLGEAVGRVEDGQSRQNTAMKALQGAIEETKAEVDKILRRPRQAD